MKVKTKPKTHELILASYNPELEMQVEDIDAYSAEFNDSAEHEFDNTSLDEL